MKEVNCTCSWPKKVNKTTVTGHAPSCPVEKTAVADREVAFQITLGKGEK